MESVTPVLPLEVIEKIIDIVAKNDSLDHPFKSPNVKACSLTCQTIRLYSRQHIFRAIRLREPEPENWNSERKWRDSIESFATLIKATPEIGEYVRELHYGIHAEFKDTQRAVLCALKLLTRLESLAIYFSFGSGSLFSWRKFSSPLYSIFPYLFRLPTLATLKLRNIDYFTLSSLIPCTKLKILHLVSVYHTHDEDPIPPSPRSIRLQELSVNARTLERITERSSLIDLGQLKNITLWVDFYHTDFVPKILESASNIERIHLHVDEWSPNSGSFVPLVSASLKTLRILCLEVFLDGLGSLRGILEPLPQIAGVNHIESLTLNINFRRPLRGDTTAADPGDDWDLLEGILLGPGWPFLESINVNMNFRNIISPRIKAKMWKKSRMLFPRLSNLPSDSTLKFGFCGSGVPHSLSQT